MNGRTVEAVAQMSGNLHSLFLTFDAVLYSKNGGAYVGSMPVLMGDDHQYHDLVSDEEVEVEWT